MRERVSSEGSSNGAFRALFSRAAKDGALRQTICGSPSLIPVNLGFVGCSGREGCLAQHCVS